MESGVAPTPLASELEHGGPFASTGPQRPEFRGHATCAEVLAEPHQRHAQVGLVGGSTSPGWTTAGPRLDRTERFLFLVYRRPGV